MGVSIYYSASRPRTLTAVEQAAIDRVISRYPVERLIAECGIVEGEYNGEAFCVYPAGDAEPEVVFEGATKLPLCSEGAFAAAVGYWCRLLSEVRRVVPDANWSVHIDDYDIAWVEEQGAFDPSG